MKISSATPLSVGLAMVLITAVSSAESTNSQTSAVNSVFDTGLRPVLELNELSSKYQAVVLELSVPNLFGSSVETMLIFPPSANTSDSISLVYNSIVWTDNTRVKIGKGDYLAVYSPEVLVEPVERVYKKRTVFRLRLTQESKIVSRTDRSDIDPIKSQFIYSKAETLLTQARKAADSTRGLSNIKQLGVGLMILLSDTDDVFPYVDSTNALKPLTKEYLKGQDLWDTQNPKGTQFRFNMALAGAQSTDIDNPSKVVMLWESDTWEDGRRLVCFADGHAKKVSSAEWEVLKKTLFLKLKRVGKPLKSPK